MIEDQIEQHCRGCDFEFELDEGYDVEDEEIEVCCSLCKFEWVV